MPERDAGGAADDARSDAITVLVVEDERALASLYDAWLSDDYDVRIAHTGRDALDLLDEAVDVVLLDRRLPGLSGREVLTAIREQYDDCQVAMVTAVEPGLDILEMGFDDYVTKPASREDIRSVVASLVDRKQYDAYVQRYFRLLSKRAALEREVGDLAEHPEYDELRADIEAVEANLDGLVDEFGLTDFDAQFYSFSSPNGVADD
ncbi:response regulator transcription factor [Halobacterium sp. KA-6]|uniref:response regulator transcription factor n=1 Tax=Halobacterium sp. KA-6 TaxID=2896368 RepID=UPI001E3816BB|nr:response regulator [Halobacterium sp. KA-6]MCD2202480.1 response regulator [Halobacterium sp. KA-6]